MQSSASSLYQGCVRRWLLFVISGRSNSMRGDWVRRVLKTTTGTGVIRARNLYPPELESDYHTFAGVSLFLCVQSSNCLSYLYQGQIF